MTESSSKVTTFSTIVRISMLQKLHFAETGTHSQRERNKFDYCNYFSAHSIQNHV